MDYWLSFFTGFFGSMHCVGMCGAIVLSYSTQGRPLQSTFSSSLVAHATYNAGRVLSYSIVGGMLGFLGAGLTTLQTVGFWFSLIAGMLLMLLGISLLRLFPGFAFSTQLALESKTRNLFFKIYQSVYNRLIASKNYESKFYIGLLTPLLPCGLLYSMFLKAASMATILQGALVMLYFGAGIIPALVITGVASSYFSTQFRAWGDKIAALSVLLMGIVLVLRAVGVSIPGMAEHHH